MLSVVCNNYDIFMFLLFELKCNILAQCAKRNNILHYAVANENVEIIEKIVALDADFGQLRQ